MSNYYDLKCLDCNAYGPYDNANRAHRELLMVMKLRPELEVLGLADKRAREGYEGYLGIEYEDSVPRVAVFLAQHIGHVVVVKSQYWNDAYFGCDKQVDGQYVREPGPRENTRDCRLDGRHEGPCSRTRLDGK